MLENAKLTLESQENALYKLGNFIVSVLLILQGKKIIHRKKSV